MIELHIATTSEDLKNKAPKYICDLCMVVDRKNITVSNPRKLCQITDGFA